MGLGWIRVVAVVRIGLVYIGLRMGSGLADAGLVVGWELGRCRLDSGLRSRLVCSLGSDKGLGWFRNGLIWDWFRVDVVDLGWV